MIDRGPMPLPQLHGVGQLPQLLCQALHFDLGVLQGSIQALDVLQEVPGAEALWWDTPARWGMGGSLLHIRDMNSTTEKADGDCLHPTTTPAGSDWVGESQVGHEGIPN